MNNRKKQDKNNKIQANLQTVHIFFPSDVQLGGNVQLTGKVKIES